jgi:radical SAM enzyme (TIGR01210 family)
VLGEAGARLLAYVMVKPMGLTEREAIEDAVATARYVFDVAAEHGVAARAALEPSFVPPGTSLERALLAGRYQPPSLWSVVEIVRRVHAAGELLVGLGDEGLSPTCAPSGCERCTPALRAALAEYNHTRDLRALQALDFGCCHVEYR